MIYLFSFDLSIASWAIDITKRCGFDINPLYFFFIPYFLGHTFPISFLRKRFSNLYVSLYSNHLDNSSKFFLVQLTLLKLIILNIRPKKSAKLYKKIWTKNGSPLMVYMKKIKTKIEKRFSH